MGRRASSRISIAGHLTDASTSSNTERDPLSSVPDNRATKNNTVRNRTGTINGNTRCYNTWHSPDVCVRVCVCVVCQFAPRHLLIFVGAGLVVNGSVAAPHCGCCQVSQSLRRLQEGRRRGSKGGLVASRALHRPMCVYAAPFFFLVFVAARISSRRWI